MNETPRCNGPFADAETCDIHGPEIRNARVRAEAYHQIVLQHRDSPVRVISNTASDGMTLAELADHLESYDFECEGGPLKNCVDWMRIKTFLKQVSA